LAMPSPTLPWRVLREASFLPVPILTARIRELDGMKK
jgi:hypothetical protein